MMSDLPRGGLTDIKFVDYDATAAEARVVAALESALNTSISTADPRRIIALALCQSIVQTCASADYGVKQTLLSYATGEALDHLGYYMNINRPQATRATCLATFTRSTSGSAETVAAGLVCKGGDLEWTAERFTFAAGSTTATNVLLTCKTAGNIGNGITTGSINTLVVPSVVVSSVTNTSESAGAIDEASDDEYAELIRLGTDSFSVAGPRGAYEYFAKQASTDVLDVSIVSSTPAYVTIYVLATGGTIPSSDLRIKVAEACSDDTVRPIGDNVTVTTPTAVEFTPNALYYISKQTAALYGLENVKAACQAAYAEYVLWQRSAIGRDIVADKLVQMLLNAGAKRVTTRFTVSGQEGYKTFQSVGAAQWALPVNGALVYDGGATPEDE